MIEVALFIIWVLICAYCARIVTFKESATHFILITLLNILLTPIASGIAWYFYYKRYWFSDSDYAQNLKNKNI